MYNKIETVASKAFVTLMALWCIVLAVWLTLVLFGVFDITFLRGC